MITEDQLGIDLELKVDDFVKNADKAKRKLNEVEESSRGTSSSFNSLFNSGREVGAALRDLHPLAIAAKVGLQAITKAATELLQAFGELGMRGGEVHGVVSVFERLADPEMARRLHDASGGFVRMADQMGRANAIMRAGLVDNDELVQWTEVVTRAAQDTNQSVEQAMTRMTAALTGGGLEEAFRTLGVNILDVRQELTTLGLSMETPEGMARALDIALAQLQDELGDVDNSAGNLNDAWTAITVTLQDWYDQMALAFSTNEDLLDFFTALNRALEEALPSAESWGETFAEAFMEIIELFVECTRVAIPVAQGINEIWRASLQLTRAVAVVNPLLWGQIDAMDDMISVSNRVGSALSSVDRVVDGLGRELDGLDSSARNAASGFDKLEESLSLFARTRDRVLGEVRQQVGQARDAAAAEQIALLPPLASQRRAQAEAEQYENPQTAGLSEEAQRRIAAANEEWKSDQDRRDAEREREADSRRSRGAQRERERQQELQDLKIALHEARMQAIEEEQAAREEAIRAEEEWTRLIERANQAAYEAEVNFLQVFAENKRLDEEARQLQIEQNARLIEQQREMADAEEEAAEERQKAMQSAMDQVGQYAGALTGIMSIVADAYGALEDAAEEDSAAQKRYAKIKGGILAAISFVEAAIEYGRAIASFASQDYGEGALHLVAGAKLTAAGVLSLRNLGGNASQGDEAGATGTFVPERDNNRALDREQAQGSQIVIFTMGSSSARLGQEYQRIVQRELPMSGLDSSMAGAGAYG